MPDDPNLWWRAAASARVRRLLIADRCGTPGIA